MRIAFPMLIDQGWEEADVTDLEIFFKENPHQFADWQRDNAALFEPMRGTVKRGPRARATMKIQKAWRKKHGYRPPSPGDAGQKTKNAADADTDANTEVLNANILNTDVQKINATTVNDKL